MMWVGSNVCDITLYIAIFMCCIIYCILKLNKIHTYIHTCIPLYGMTTIDCNHKPSVTLYSIYPEFVFPYRNNGDQFCVAFGVCWTSVAYILWLYWFLGMWGNVAGRHGLLPSRLAAPLHCLVGWWSPPLVYLVVGVALLLTVMVAGKHEEMIINTPFPLLPQIQN